MNLYFTVQHISVSFNSKQKKDRIFKSRKRERNKEYKAEGRKQIMRVKS